MFFVFVLIGIIITATGDSNGLWWHLYETVIGKYILNTLLLMSGVSISVLLLGVGTTWLVSRDMNSLVGGFLIGY